MNIYEAMATQRAVRRLRPDPIPGPVIERIFQAAAWAPTGGNVQPFRMVAVTDREKLAATYDKLEQIAEQQGSVEKASAWKALKTQATTASFRLNGHQAPSSDRQSLLVIRQSTGFARWTKNKGGRLSLDKHGSLGVCDGVTVDKGGQVIALDLDGTGLSGKSMLTLLPPRE